MSHAAVRMMKGPERIGKLRDGLLDCLTWRIAIAEIEVFLDQQQLETREAQGA